MSKAPISPQSQNCTANTLCSQGFGDLVSSLTETVQIETASSSGSDSSGTEGNGNRQCSHSENRHSAPSGVESVSPGSTPPPPPPWRFTFWGLWVVGGLVAGIWNCCLLFVLNGMASLLGTTAVGRTECVAGAHQGSSARASLAVWLSSRCGLKSTRRNL